MKTNKQLKIEKLRKQVKFLQKLLDITTAIFNISLFYIAIAIVWNIIEYSIFGKLVPKTAHTIIVATLAISTFILIMANKKQHWLPCKIEVSHDNINDKE